MLVKHKPTGIIHPVFLVLHSYRRRDPYKNNYLIGHQTQIRDHWEILVMLSVQEYGDVVYQRPGFDRLRGTNPEGCTYGLWTGISPNSEYWEIIETPSSNIQALSLIEEG